MPVEIDESELAGLRNLQATVNKMLQNPKSRDKLLRAQKDLDPNISIPELDAKEPVMEEIKKLSDRFEAFATESAKEKTAREENERVSSLKNQWERGRASLRDAGYNDEGVKKIEELMEKEGIANHHAAAAYFDKLNPAPEVIKPMNNGFEIFSPTSRTSADTKMLFENPDQWADKVIAETLAESRGGVRR